jgi:hypothetical protein
LILDTNKITFEVVRGDTFYLPLELNSGTRERPKAYKLQGNDRLYVGIMSPGQSFENATVRTTLDASSPKDGYGNTLLFLNHNDTKNLEPGKYYISIKLVSDGNVTTLVDQKLFFVTGTPIRGWHTI